MKREFAGVMKDSPLHFDFRSRGQAPREALSDLVVVRFTGSCVLEPVGYLYDERGPMAYQAPSSTILRSMVAPFCVSASLGSSL